MVNLFKTYYDNSERTVALLQEVAILGSSRVRVGALVYACRAVRVVDAVRIEELRAAAATKYDLDPDGAAASTEV